MRHHSFQHLRQLGAQVGILHPAGENKKVNPGWHQGAETGLLRKRSRSCAHLCRGVCVLQTICKTTTGVQRLTLGTGATGQRHSVPAAKSQAGRPEGVGTAELLLPPSPAARSARSLRSLVSCSAKQTCLVQLRLASLYPASPKPFPSAQAGQVPRPGVTLLRSQTTRPRSRRWAVPGENHSPRLPGLARAARHEKPVCSATLLSSLCLHSRV